MIAQLLISDIDEYIRPIVKQAGRKSNVHALWLPYNRGDQDQEQYLSINGSYEGEKIIIQKETKSKAT